MHRLMFEPAGGLANRLRAIESAVALALDLDAPLDIHWTQDAGMGCYGYRVVRKPARVARFFDWPHSRRWLRFAVEAPRRRFLDRLSRSSARRLSTKEASALGDDLDAWRDALAQTDLYVTTHSSVYQPGAPYRHIRFADRILKRFEATEAAATQDLVGVHIRRQDMAQSIEISKTEFFKSRIEELLQETPSTRFLLATDDADEERELSRAFPGKLVIPKKNTRHRKFESAITEAAIDFLSLAKTRLILGSAGSSFSKEAARWGGVPLEIVGVDARGAAGP